MLVRPCVQNVPGKIGEVNRSGYSLHPRESGPVVVQGPGSVTTSPTLLGLLGVETAEQSEIAVDREAFRLHLGLLPSRLSPKESRARK